MNAADLLLGVLAAAAVLVRGLQHSAKLREVARRGDAHYWRLHPECVPRGENRGGAKLDDAKVRRIFQLHAEGWKGYVIALELGVSKMLVSAVLARKIWSHVKLEERSCSQ